jgi:hypothetical protein
MKIALNPAQLAAAARLFSSAVIHEMARGARSPLFRRLAHESNLTEAFTIDGTVGNFFDDTFALLKKKAYRYEYVYKTAIAHKLLLGIHSLQTASMLSEFRVGPCKADLVILNGTSTVYEVKSERDNVDRLRDQVAAYRRVFSKINVIAAEDHVKAVTDVVPTDVGILVLSSRHQISTLREAIDRPDAIEPCAVFDSLHRNEALKVLEIFGIPAPNVPNTRFHGEMVKIFSDLPPRDLHGCMISVLKETRSLRALSGLVNEVPKSLQMATLSTQLRQRDHNNLIAALNTPLPEALTWS